MKVTGIFNQLVTGREIKIRTGTKKEHDNLRTSLCKRFKKHKALLSAIGFADDSATLSLCATYLADAGVSHFRIATRKQDSKEWEVVTDET